MKTICNISRFIGEIFVFVGKFGLFVYFVLRMLLISCSFVSAGARESQRVKATGLQNRRQIGKHNKEKAAIFGYAAFLIYVSMINHKSEIPQYRFSIEAPEK